MSVLSPGVGRTWSGAEMGGKTSELESLIGVLKDLLKVDAIHICLDVPMFSFHDASGQSSINLQKLPPEDHIMAFLTLTRRKL
eukprot:705012-Rhodomonas_salina.1